MMRGRLPAIGCKDGREGERTLERLRRGNKRMNEGRKAIAMEGRDPIDGQHKANLYFGGGGKNNCSSPPRPTECSFTHSADARWEWAIRSEVSYILRSPPSLGLRKRKGEVDDCGCCIRNTHSLNRANQEGGEQDRKWREGSVRDNQDDMRKQPLPLLHTSYVLILLV